MTNMTPSQPENQPQAQQHIQPQPRRPVRRSVVLPVALVLAGAVALLINLKVIPAATGWALIQLWPLLLVAWGLELVAPTKSWGQAVSLAVLALAVVAATWLSVRPQGFVGVESHSISSPRPAGTQQAAVSIETSVSRLTLSRGEVGAALLSGTAQTLPGERLVQEASHQGGSALVRLSAQSVSRMWARAGPGADWNLRLAPDLPLDLNVTTGVGSSELDLRGVQVTDLKLTVGVGSSTLTLPDAGPLQARLSGGVGTLTLRVPRDLPVRLTIEPGVGRVEADPALRRSDNRSEAEYRSSSYDTAPAADRAEVRVTGGVGSVRLDTLP